MSKFKRNLVSHEDSAQKLADLGWQVMVIWECELSDIDALKEKVCAFLQGNPSLNPKMTSE